MKYIKYLLLSIILFFCLIINCSASTKTFERTKENLLVPDSVAVSDDNIDDILKTKAISVDEKIYDFAELLTEGEEKQLLKKINSYRDTTKMDLVIVTVNDLEGYSEKDYANNFYKYNDFREDGVIFLISVATSDTSIYMVNNGKAANIYTDGIISKTLKYVYTDIENKKYSDALDDYVKILDRYYQLKEKVEENDEKEVVNDTNTAKVKNTISTRDIVLLSLALAFLISMIVYYVLTQKKIKRMKELKKTVITDVNTNDTNTK